MEKRKIKRVKMKLAANKVKTSEFDIGTISMCKYEEKSAFYFEMNCKYSFSRSFRWIQSIYYVIMVQ